MAKPETQPEEWLKEIESKLRDSLGQSFSKFFDQEPRDELASNRAYTKLFPIVAECLREFLGSPGCPTDSSDALVKLVAPWPCDSALEAAVHLIPFTIDDDSIPTRGYIYRRLLELKGTPQWETFERPISSDGKGDGFVAVTEESCLDPLDYLRPASLWEGVVDSCSGLASVRAKLPAEWAYQFLYVLRDEAAWYGFSSEVQTRLKRTPETTSQSVATAQTQALTISTPDGTTWSDVSIRFLSDHMVRISVKGKDHQHNSAELGFDDGRSPGTPIRSWVALRELAQHDPQELKRPNMSTGDSGAAVRRSKQEKVVQDIRKRLQALLPGVEGDPIAFSSEETAYRPTFKLSFPAFEVL